MKTATSQPLYAAQSIPALEAIATPTTNWFFQLGQTFAKLLTVDPEPKVTKVMDRNGEIWWRVYNPEDSTIHWLGSEDELRNWFDTTYRR